MFKALIYCFVIQTFDRMFRENAIFIRNPFLKMVVYINYTKDMNA